jgi:hypothetical protein
MSGERLPAIGARFRKDRIDPMTGRILGTFDYVVIEIEPKLSMLPRRAVLQREDGCIARPDVEHLWGCSWKALDNVVSLPLRTGSRTTLSPPRSPHGA